jgi:DNA invertase Pin-like site-specific DNA recombinase
MRTMRVLGAIRQSKTRERAVSPAEQRRRIQKWADENGHEVVKFTVDPSQSGKLPARKRPNLGPWLTDLDRVAAWDILVTTKIDRACRNTQDFLWLLDWCKEQRKTFVSLRENIDMTTAQGRQSARDAASRAEWERDMASERRLDTLAELAEQGRWSGGRISYGLRADEREDGFYLVPDDGGTADIARHMADMSIAGQSNAKIQRWLNDNSHPNANGQRWSIERVRLVLHSEAMADVLGEEKHAQLRTALRSRARRRGEWTSGRHYLLRVAYCRTCKAPLYAALKRDRPSGGYYRCLKCGMVTPLTTLEDGIESDLRNVWGNQPYRQRRLIPGDDHAKEIKRLERQLEQAQELEFVDTSPLEAKIAELRAAPYEPDRVVLVDTHQTVAEHWDELDGSAERNRFLRDRDVRYLVTPDDFEPWSMPAEWNPRHLVKP